MGHAKTRTHATAGLGVQQSTGESKRDLDHLLPPGIGNVSFVVFVVFPPFLKKNPHQKRQKNKRIGLSLLVVHHHQTNSHLSRVAVRLSSSSSPRKQYLSNLSILILARSVHHSSRCAAHANSSRIQTCIITRFREVNGLTVSFEETVTSHPSCDSNVLVHCPTTFTQKTRFTTRCQTYLGCPCCSLR